MERRKLLLKHQHWIPPECKKTFGLDVKYSDKIKMISFAKLRKPSAQQKTKSKAWERGNVIDGTKKKVLYLSNHV